MNDWGATLVVSSAGRRAARPPRCWVPREGAAVGALAATVINSVIRSRYSKEHEKEADRIGTELALARGFDPEDAVRFWERQHERFGKRSLSPKIGNSLFGSHPRDRVRAENLRALLAADLKSAIDDKRTAGGLVTGTPRFGSRPRAGHPGAPPGRDAPPPQPRPGWKAQLR